MAVNSPLLLNVQTKVCRNVTSKPAVQRGVYSWALKTLQLQMW